MNAGTFIAKCQSIFTDNAGVRRVGGKYSGPFIDEGRLASASVGDLRVFAKRSYRTFKDWGIHILVDCSGSMEGGRRVQPACDAVNKLYAALNKAGVGSVEVSGFNQFLHPYNQAVLQDPRELTRKITWATRRDIPWQMNGHAGNHDGHAVRETYRKLNKSGSAGKLIIVFSDGRPKCDATRVCTHPGCGYSIGEDLRDAVIQARRSGVMCLGVGISVSHVKEYYGDAHSTSVYNLDELFTKTSALLQRHIIRG